MTQLTKALKGETTPEMAQVAAAEGVSPGFVREGVAAGTIVIPRNARRTNVTPVGIGAGLKTKVSASVGLHGKNGEISTELAKVKAALEAGTDAIMDLSVSGDIDAMRRETLALSPKPVGTLPLYQALAEAALRHGSPAGMKVEELFAVIERHAADGVDFLALHCGLTMDVVERARKDGRTDPLVSYGGSHLIGWMLHNQAENPLYTQYDRVLEIARRYDVTVSLADGMRPGCLADSLDGAQVQELVVLGELVRRAREAGVQIMVKGPGHVPLNQLKATVTLQKSLCKGAPYFVFGPVITDIAAGYDHISAAIGGAITAMLSGLLVRQVLPQAKLWLVMRPAEWPAVAPGSGVERIQASGPALETWLWRAGVAVRHSSWVSSSPTSSPGVTRSGPSSSARAAATSAMPQS
ncbi:MAG: phosphomethylpyrimidine synthase ThiC [Peptococcaceae bacterium]|nr:phosphomethylpyrimidine synthase ThiC [Peptococcaceae bacterium]